MAELIVRVHETVASYIANAEDKSLATDIGNEVLQLSRAVVKHHTFPEQQRYKYYLAQPSRMLARDVYRGPARGGSHVARLNFKTSRVGVY